MKVELHFVRKGYPQMPPVLTIHIMGDSAAVEKVMAAVRKAVGEELTDLEESAYMASERRPPA